MYIHTHINVIVCNNISLNVYYFLSFRYPLYTSTFLLLRDPALGTIPVSARDKKKNWSRRFLSPSSVSVSLSRDSATTQYPSRGIPVGLLSSSFRIDWLPARIRIFHAESPETSLTGISTPFPLRPLGSSSFAIDGVRYAGRTVGKLPFRKLHVHVMRMFVRASEGLDY